MFQSKSFNLVRAEDQKKREVLYQPKRLRWLKYVVVPALICFMLALILLNVDFTGTAYTPRTTIGIMYNTTAYNYNLTTPPPTNATITGNTTNSLSNSTVVPVPNEYPTARERKFPYNLNEIWNTSQSIAISGCSQTDVCSLSCYKCEAGKLQSIFEAQYRACEDKINVELVECNFPKADLTKNIFQGDYQMRSLTIDNCDLVFIADKVFDQSSTAKIESLIFRQAQFNVLTEQTFIGLQTLKVFKFNNRKNFVSNKSFLQSMAGTIETLFVQFEGKNNLDPGVWLGPAPYEYLQYVDFSSNKFPNTLTNTTFHSLTHVQSLILSNCSIEVIAEGTFKTIMPTLKYLDLSNNKLTTLDGEFLVATEVRSLNLELFGNAWSCSCANERLINAIQDVNMVFREEPKCATPANLRNFYLKTISLRCDKIDDESETPGLYNPIEINCRNKAHDGIYEQVVRNQDIPFVIRSISGTAVQVQINQDMTKYDFFYFSRQNVTKPRQSVTAAVALLRASVVTNKQIFGLNPNHSYVFCIIPDFQMRISPFNCQSHHLLYTSGIEKWLDTDDQAFFYALTAMGIILAIIIGIFSAYLVLRCNPTWLCGSKRLVRASKNSKDVFLLPKHADKDYMYSILPHRSSLNSTSNSELHLSPNDYMDYYRTTLEGKRRNVQFSETRVPTHMAPSVPRSSCQFNSHRNTNHADRHFAMQEYQSSSSALYEAIDYYEEIL